MSKKIFVVGLGTIGKRVSDAIMKQKDMELLGVGDIVVTYKLHHLAEKGVALYTIPEKTNLFKEKNLEPAGTLQEGIEKADLIVDATPAGIGEKNKPKYEKAGTKAIFQGGESASVADKAFNSFWNYQEVMGAQFVQVVSCNTTALCRITYALRDYGVERVRGVLIRRGGDPKQTDRGPLNAILPKHNVPSHHAHDVQRCIPDLDITTVALKVPTTLMHAHTVNVSLEESPTKDEILKKIHETSRVLNAKEALDSTAKIVEWSRDLGRKRYDTPEVVVWPGTVNVEDNEVWLSYAVHQESIVIPENLDAIRSMLKIEESKEESLEKTNETLDIRKEI